ncbi:bacteriohopanetetrol glucosamine biosynthesis glycosyltransferase HpnI [Novosphingobium sp.]|uniref:bacteriohopanetetrol glucosamine biosynthesis glycosyltransferase HpnI n=1 Tax=Novosphingobium sp. TaxID=1874826 RepID=UPI001D5F7216|nr:bacteriohopanetetrol glucosamine biosynthesis glycosyltransferase HpnI [Novosphingobium sp.]MBX9665158.1 bacteriohopanetetrol glucosamine biosynthesis glycosyltransferase HpnI [Novosphingobium sp.]
MTAAASIASLIGWLILALAAVGTLYWAVATRVPARFLQEEKPAAARFEAVTLLKPLHGAEPQLEANLASFLRQTHKGPLQMVCGVQRADDPAAQTVRALQARHRGARIDLVIDSTRHGANAKIGNLINMMARAEHDIVVVSDSDMAVEPNYLAQVLAALEAPGVGAVTCLYHGRGDAGFWSRLAAAGPSYQFVVGLVFGKVMGLAEPCMGSTIALRRSTLEAIGEFEAFADVLADDHAMGAAIRAQGLGIAIPPMLLAHASAEQNLGQVWRQELRWAATIRALAPAGYAGSLIGFPLALAMVGCLFHLVPGLCLVAAAFAVRLFTKRVVDRHAAASTAPWWLLPARDAFSLAVFVASYFVRVVDWRGTRLRMEDDGQIVSPAETTSS